MGRTVLKSGDELKVRYRHPVTRQLVTATVGFGERVQAPRPGAAIRVVVEHDDPLSVTAAGGGSPLPLRTNAPLYAVVTLAAGLPWLYRRFHIRRAERLAESPTTTFAMRGALFKSRFGRSYLSLYALDAVAGADPLCSVRVLTTAMAPQSEVAFALEVKGSPRPLGRVVASCGDNVFWPAGASLALRRNRRRPIAESRSPVRLAPVPDPQLAWHARPWRFLAVPGAALVASLALTAVVTGVTLQQSGEAQRWWDRAVPAVGTVIAHSGEDAYVVVRYRRAGRLREARAPVYYDSDYSTGIKYPIRVDPQRAGSIRLESEPYDTVEPIAWSLATLAAALPWLLHRLAAWRRFTRAARKGPWRRAVGRFEGLGGLDAVSLGVGDGDHVVVTLPVGHAHVRDADHFELLVAGELDPGNSVAAWRDGQALVPAGLASAPEPRAQWSFVEDAGHLRGPPRTATTDAAPERVEIKSYWFSWRKPRLNVFGERVELVLPSYFTEPWWIPADEVAAFDLTRDDDPPFEDGLTAPYLPTTSPLSSETLLLLFTRPQRVPPVKWVTRFANNVDVPWGYRRSRSEEGDFADGVMLRATNPSHAVRALTAGRGTVPVARDWLRRVRPELSDPARMAEVRRRRSKDRLRAWIGASLSIGAMLFLGVVGGLMSNAAFVAVCLVATLGTVLMYQRSRS
ncbi:MAG TPA: hypothetical protein VMZ22_05290 [Acidimicrobiales bacterium]|nr:hypothetical protein [Acidimicrobiales bacterium]